MSPGTWTRRQLSRSSHSAAQSARRPSRPSVRSASALQRVIIEVSIPHPSATVAYDDDTLLSLLRDRRDTFSEKVVFSQKRAGEWRTTTWGEYAADITRLSRALLDHGLQKGDCVAIIDRKRTSLNSRP